MSVPTRYILPPRVTGDRYTPIAFAVRDGGALVDFTGSTVRLKMRALVAPYAVVIDSEEMEADAAGMLTYVPKDGEDPPGDYDGQITITRPGQGAWVGPVWRFTLLIRPAV